MLNRSKSNPLASASSIGASKKRKQMIKKVYDFVETMNVGIPLREKYKKPISCQSWGIENKNVEKK